MNDREMYVMISVSGADSITHFDLIPATDTDAARDRWQRMRGESALEVELMTIESFVELANQLAEVSMEQAEVDCAEAEADR